MKSKLVAFAAFITVMAVLGSFYAKPLLAQVRAALVANIDEPARSPFQVTFNGSCPADSCFLVANPVPPNKRLHITHINAFTTVPFQAQLERVPAAGVSDALAFLPSPRRLEGTSLTRTWIFTWIVAKPWRHSSDPSPLLLCFTRLPVI